MSWRGAVCIAILAVACFSTAAAGQARPEAKKKATGAGPPAEIVRERFRIIFPPEFDAKNRLTPVVYALHGYGGGMDDMASAWREPCARAGVILIVAQGAKTVGNGFSWSGFEDAGKMIDAAKAELRKTFKPHRFAPRVLTGFSQGSWATYSLALRYPKTYRRIIPAAGMFKARSYQVAEGLSDNEKSEMVRWKVYMMVGVQDRPELVSNNRWLATELEKLGARVKAPFADRTDPSWDLYQNIGHAYPRDRNNRIAEQVRALKFVLQPDSADRKNWDRIDPDWRAKAGKWLESDAGDQGKAKKKSKKKRRKKKSRKG